MILSKKLNKVSCRVAKLAVFFTGVCALNLPVNAQVSVISCGEVKDSDDRLACYDRAAEQVQNLPVIRLPRTIQKSSSESYSTNIVSSDPSEEIVVTDAFGLDSDLSKGTTRRYSVMAAKHNDFVGWRIEFDAGGIWKQVGTDNYDIDVGAVYTIRKASVGSYFLSNSNNNKKMRLSRVE